MRNIDLHLPKGWNQCSLPELRAIAEIIVGCQMSATRFHPFNIDDVKIAVFFRLTGLEVVRGVDRSLPVEEQYYVCRLRPYGINDERRFFFTRWRKFRRWCKTVVNGDDSFPVYLWMILSWLTEKKRGKRVIPGKLDWLDTEKGNQLLVFPFASVRRSRGRAGRKILFSGPAPFMDGFTWQRYRFAQDYMDLYIKTQNRLLQFVAAMGRKPDKQKRRQLAQLVRTLNEAQAHFLATIFNRRISFVDETTGKTRNDFHYKPTQHTDNAAYFRRVSRCDWQIVTLWWQGMMHFLHKTYPKVFKKQPVSDKRNKKPVNPLELYTRTTATLEKYLHATAHEIDNEPYTTVLQQLEDITRKNEEIEKMNRKMKKK